MSRLAVNNIVAAFLMLVITGSASGEVIYRDFVYDQPIHDTMSISEAREIAQRKVWDESLREAGGIFLRQETVEDDSYKEIIQIIGGGHIKLTGYQEAFVDKDAHPYLRISGTTVVDTEIMARTVKAIEQNLQLKELLVQQYRLLGELASPAEASRHPFTFPALDSGSGVEFTADAYQLYQMHRETLLNTLARVISRDVYGHAIHHAEHSVKLLGIVDTPGADSVLLKLQIRQSLDLKPYVEVVNRFWEVKSLDCVEVVGSLPGLPISKADHEHIMHRVPERRGSAVGVQWEGIGRGGDTYRVIARGGFAYTHDSGAGKEIICRGLLDIPGVSFMEIPRYMIQDAAHWSVRMLQGEDLRKSKTPGDKAWHTRYVLLKETTI